MTPDSQPERPDVYLFGLVIAFNSSKSFSIAPNPRDSLGIFMARNTTAAQKRAGKIGRAPSLVTLHQRQSDFGAIWRILLGSSHAIRQVLLRTFRRGWLGDRSALFVEPLSTTTGPAPPAAVAEVNGATTIAS
jgi:hypothetical protein